MQTLMQILLPPEPAQRLRAALVRAGTREIGGILMGEHIGEQAFRVKDLTIQPSAGSFASFVRAVQDMLAPLTQFFRTTNHDYTRFNYLGEWHSHPSFVPEPSGQDRTTMREIINDREVGANFVVLMIVKLNRIGQLEGSVTVFQPGGVEYGGELVVENTNGQA